MLKTSGLMHAPRLVPRIGRAALLLLRAAARLTVALLRRHLTRGGALYLLALVGVALAATVSGNNLLFLILAAMLSALMISGLVSRLTLAGLELDVFLPEHITARRAVKARVQVRNLKRWLPSFSVELRGRESAAVSSPLYFPMLPCRTRIEESVEVRFERRGVYQAGTFRLSTCFPFGFVPRHVEVTLPTQVLVYPSVDPQPGFEELLASVRGELETQARGRGYDFYRIRPYEPMESARHVDWKATAHTGELQVREFAREQERLLEIFLDLDVPEPLRPWFEWALECCAFLVWRVSERAGRLRFRTQLYDLTLPEMGDVYSVLKYLAVVEPVHGKPVPSPGLEDSSQVVFSARPAEQLRDLGWDQARIVSPAEVPNRRSQKL